MLWRTKPSTKSAVEAAAFSWFFSQKKGFLSEMDIYYIFGFSGIKVYFQI